VVPVGWQQQRCPLTHVHGSHARVTKQRVARQIWLTHASQRKVGDCLWRGGAIGAEFSRRGAREGGHVLDAGVWREAA